MAHEQVVALPYADAQHAACLWDAQRSCGHLAVLVPPFNLLTLMVRVLLTVEFMLYDGLKVEESTVISIERIP